MATNTAPPVRLTPARLAVLRAAANGTLFRSHRIHDLYRTWDDAAPSNRGRRRYVPERTVDALARADLMRVADPMSLTAAWVLTDAGRAALDGAR